MKNLLYIANLRLPTEKAYGIQIVKMCEAFSMAGSRVELIVPTRHNAIQESVFSYYNVRGNFSVQTLKTPDFYFSGAFDRIAVFIKEFISALRLMFFALNNSAEIIYSRDELPIYFLSFFRENIVFEAHRYSQRRAWYYRRFKNSGVKIVVISRGIREKFLELGFSPSQVLLAPDGVDLQQFQGVQTKKEARDLLKLPDDKILVVYTGHLYSWKGVDTLAQAAKLLDECFRVVVVGGSEEDVAWYSKKYSDCSNIFFIGWRPHRLMPAYLKAADILVLPNSNKEDISNTYTSPLKMFEYMASDRPIIASDLPSIREILTEEMAYFVRPNNPEALAIGIRDATINIEESRRRASQALREIARYSWASRARSILRFAK